MADEDAQDPGVSEDALPMQKASPVAFIVGGVALLVIGGLVVFGMSGGDDPKQDAQTAEREADEAQGMTKQELEERQAHLRKTQAALIAAAADDAEEDKKEKQATQKQQSASQSSPSAKAAPKASPGPAKKPVNTKKTADSLDALGADITSALE